MEDPSLVAARAVDVSPEFAKNWFLALKEHPERYAFDTHAGFVFTEGTFGEPGARFQTREEFGGLVNLVLKFELVEVGDSRFTFELLSPMRGVWGYFEIGPAEGGGTMLHLAVGSNRPTLRRLLELPPVRNAIRSQIEGEVANIGASMESVSEEEV